MFDIGFSDNEKLKVDGEEMSYENYINLLKKHGGKEVKGFFKVFISDDKGFHAVYKYCTKIILNGNEFIVD